MLEWLIDFAQTHAMSAPAVWTRDLIGSVAPQLNDPAASFFLGWGIVLLIILSLYYAILPVIEARRMRDYVRRLIKAQIAITPDDFTRLRRDGELPEFTGVYVIHNTSDDLFYVGQSIHVIQRVNDHLNGHGSPDVYADLRFGRQFELFMRPLAHSGFSTLNAFEKATIKAFDAYKKGYNKTRGNDG